MRDWALPIFRCPMCHGLLRRDGATLACEECGQQFRTVNDITDFTADLHPIAARERDAVHRSDEVPDESVSRLAGLLREFVDDRPLAPEDLRAFPCLGHAHDARQQIRHVLARRPLPRHAIVVEVGADHCWSSSVLLEHGCRVVACDITNHLALAPAGPSPFLCRVYADMNRLPVADAAVDVFWATAAVHHSWDLGRTFVEAARVLRPGGWLYLCCEPMPSRLRHAVGHSFGEAERRRGINERWIRRSEWLAHCRRASLVPELVFPELDRATLAAKLSRRGLPVALVPLIKPLLRSLQVSIHLVAQKPGG